MELFKITKDNKPSLRVRSTPVEFPLNKKTEETLLNMLEYIKMSQDDEFAEKHHIRSGVGLAAPQIGINKQMLAIYFKDEDNKVHQYCLINPRIISESIKLCYLPGGEGCLSVDGKHDGYVYRPFKITVKAYDLLKKSDVEYTLSGYPAVVAQHEIDHLKGILFYDHINKTDPFEKKNGAIAV